MHFCIGCIMAAADYPVDRRTQALEDPDALIPNRTATSPRLRFRGANCTVTGSVLELGA